MKITQRTINAFYKGKRSAGLGGVTFNDAYNVAQGMLPMAEHSKLLKAHNDTFGPFGGTERLTVAQAKKALGLD